MPGEEWARWLSTAGRPRSCALRVVITSAADPPPRPLRVSWRAARLCCSLARPRRERALARHPASHSLPCAQGEFAYWLGPAADVLTYHGSAAARAIMAEHELWLAPACLDGRPLPEGWGLAGRVPFPDVVLAR